MGFGLVKTLTSLLVLAPLLVHTTPVVDTSATQQAPVVQHFTSPSNPDISLRFVADSGVCESTPGVHQMSGYIDVGTNMSMVCGLSSPSRWAQLPLNRRLSGSGSSNQERRLRLPRSHFGWIFL